MRVVLSVLAVLATALSSCNSRVVPVQSSTAEVAAFSPKARNGIVYFVNGSDGLRYADALARPALGDLSGAIDWFRHLLLERLRRIVRL